MIPTTTMVYAIIVAGGKGERMGREVRKQYLSLGGRPILAVTLARFLDCTAVDEICLVVPEADFDFCRETIIGPLPPRKPVHLAPAGVVLRQESVYNGLCAIHADNQDVVLIHDGVRPFVTSALIAALIETAGSSGACIPGIAVHDTLKRVDPQGLILETPEREHIRMVQTPQAFHYWVIKAAHEEARRDDFTGTDDAALVERFGKPVTVIPGSRWNIKITTAEDLQLAQLIQPLG